VLGIAAVTAVCAPFHDQLEHTTVALALLLVVLFVASMWGSWPALFTSVLGVLSFNFFFLPPVYAFTIADQRNWVALGAFLITAITAGQLSELVKRRAAEAESFKRETRLRSAYHRSLLEASLDPLVTIGADGRITDVNSAMETVTGRSREDLIGKDFTVYFTEPVRARAGYEQALAEGFVRDYALELRHRDGHITSVLYNASLYRDDDGKVIGVVAAARSISTSAGEPGRPAPVAGVVKGLRRFSVLAGLFSVAVGLLALVGWTFGITLLKSVVPGQVIIKANAAVCLVLLGCSLWLLQSPDDRPVHELKKLGGRAMAGIVALVGAFALAEHGFGWDLGIDQLLFRDENPWEAFGSVRPGLIAPITALDFLLLGLALVRLDWTVSIGALSFWPAQFLALAAGIGSVVGLLDFVLGSHTSYTHIALQTALALFVLSWGLVFARSERGLPALLASPGVGGSLTRWLLPATILIPMVIGMLSWRSYTAGLSSEWGSGALLTVAMMVLLGGLTIRVGYLVDRSDSERRKAEAGLRRREEELREAQRLAHAGNWWWDARSDIMAWSEGMYRITGRDPKLPPPGVKEQSYFYTPESYARLEAAIDAAIRTGAPYELALEMVRSDGAVRSVTSRGEAERDSRGRAVLVRGAVHDVTERRQAEAALAGANRALRTLSACNQALVRAGNESELLDSTCRLIVEKGGYRMAWVGYAEHDPEKSVRPAAQSGYEEGYLAAAKISWADTERGRGPTGTAIRTGTVQVNQNFLTNPALALWRAAALQRDYQSSIALPLKSSSGVLGALSIYGREPDRFMEDEVMLLRELADDLAFGIETLRTRAERDRIAYEHRHHEELLRQSLEDSVKAIANTVEARDPYTAGHQRRVGQLAAAIGRELGLPEQTIHGIELAASIHDVGKINIPAEILARPAKLTDIEFMLVKIHAQAGYEILKGIHFPWPIATIVRQHHERMDGSGYPGGLKESDILMEARIMAVADVVETMASHRPYRAALGIDAALKEIESGRGTVYDAAVVDACMKLFAQKRFAFTA
jgi:PAS domain S-box-containing protein